MTSAVASGPRPAPGVVRRLGLYDPLLEVRWNPEVERWQIGRWRPFSKILDYVMTVANEDGSYRPLDERIFEGLVFMDGARRTRRALLNDIDEHNRLLRSRQFERDTPIRRSIWRDAFARHVRGRKVFGPSNRSDGRP